MKMRPEGIYKNAFFGNLKATTAMGIYVLVGGGPKDSENTLNSFLTKNKEKLFWQIGADLFSIRYHPMEVIILSTLT